MLSFIILGISLLIYFVARTRILTRKLNLPPEYPDRWPVIGSANLLYGRDTKELLKLLIKVGAYLIKHEGIAHAYVGPVLVIIITDPDDSITVLNTCLEKNWAYEFVKNWVGDGLVSVTSNLAVWKRHRKIISRAFNPHVLDSYVGIFNKESRRLVEELAAKVGKGPFDHMDNLKVVAYKTMIQTTMGFMEDEIDDNDITEHIEALDTILNIISKRFQRFWLYNRFIYNFTSLKKKEDEVLAVLHKKSIYMIKRKKLALKKKEKDSMRFKAFLDLLLDLPPHETFTDQEIREEVDTMIIAGSDTSVTMLTYALILLGSNQDVQNIVYEEIRKLFGNSYRDVDKQELTKLVFLEAVLMETMRLYPILPAILRYVSEDIKLRNFTIPAGSSCMVLAYSMHRDPTLWGSDAAQFRPQRWMPPEGPPLAARAFAGFSMGKRGCIGKTQAMMFMKIVLAHILRHYRIIADVNKLELQLDSLLKPASGCEISLERRN